MENITPRSADTGQTTSTSPASGGRSPARRPPQPRVRLSSPADVLAAVPRLLGFHPGNSLVVIGAGGRSERVRFGCRYDLPDPPAPAAAAGIAEHAAAVLTREHLKTVIVVGYGPGRLVTPLADVFAPVLARNGLTLREMLRVEDGRYWSYLCREPRCCAPEGVPFDITCHPVAAEMAAAGLPAYPDREALAASLAPVTGRAAENMSAATGRAYARAESLLARGAGTGPGGALALVAVEGRRAVQEIIAAYRAGSAVTDDQLAWLAVSITDLRVRDDAWARMEPEHQAAHLRLWTDVVRRAEPALVPAPAALLAFVAWQSGNGPLAGIAVERALAADPGYSLALLMSDILNAGVPPSQARLLMTPEEVEESYERVARSQRGRRRPARRGAGGRAPAAAAGRARQPSRRNADGGGEACQP